MRSTRLRAVLSAAGLLLSARAFSAAAGDWRPVMTRAFRTLDDSRADAPEAAALESLRSLWEGAPELGSEWALRETEPILDELQAGTFQVDGKTVERLTPETFADLPASEQTELLRLAAGRSTVASRGNAESLIGEIGSRLGALDTNDQDSLKRLIAWKSGLLALEHRRLYLEPRQSERLDLASRSVNEKLWKTRGEAMNGLAQLTDKAAIRNEGMGEMMQLGVLGLMRSRSGWPNAYERKYAAELKPYSPALDPNRFFFLKPDAALSNAILGDNPWTMAYRHALSMGPSLPAESFVFMREPLQTESPHSALHAHIALHEGHHQAEPPGVRERLFSALEPAYRLDAASVLAHIVIEGHAEKSARKSSAAMLRDGETGKTRFLRQVFEDFQDALPRPKPTVSFEDWVDLWLEKVHHHTYGPYVQLVRRLQDRLGGMFALEDLVYRGEISGLQRLLEGQESVLRMIGRQLRPFIQYGVENVYQRPDDFELRKVWFDALDEMLAGRRYSEQDVSRILDLNDEYHFLAHQSRSALLPKGQTAFTEAVRAPLYSDGVTSRDVRSHLEQAARSRSWVPYWVPLGVWRFAFFLCRRLGLPLL